MEQIKKIETKLKMNGKPIYQIHIESTDKDQVKSIITKLIKKMKSEKKFTKFMITSVFGQQYRTKCKFTHINEFFEGRIADYLWDGNYDDDYQHKVNGSITKYIFGYF